MHERESPEVKGLLEGLEDGPNEAQKRTADTLLRPLFSDVPVGFRRLKWPARYFVPVKS